MKKDIHPNYHIITVKMLDGTLYKTKSTWGKKNDIMTLDVDPTTHPAWTGGDAQLTGRGGRLNKFNKRFKNILS